MVRWDHGYAVKAKGMSKKLFSSSPSLLSCTLLTEPKGRLPPPTLLLFCPAPPACVHVNRCVYIIRLFTFFFFPTSDPSHTHPQGIFFNYNSMPFLDIWDLKIEINFSTTSIKCLYVSSYIARDKNKLLQCEKSLNATAPEEWLQGR